MNKRPSPFPSSIVAAASMSGAHRHPARAVDAPPPLENTGLDRLEGYLNNTSHNQKNMSPEDSARAYATGMIYASSTASPPNTHYSLERRMNLLEDYTHRVASAVKYMGNYEGGEANVHFQNVRQFLTPAGYFSGGLLAAGCDPNEKITVTFNSYVGKWKPEVKTNTDTHTYSAWEIAAGALKHDRTPEGGLLNFQDTIISPEDGKKIKELEALGAKLQAHWAAEVTRPMADVSSELAKRSGKADAYVLRGTLQSLRNDKGAFEHLTQVGHEAINRTLDNGGNVVIPNIYGYPLAGYAFIPYTNYHGDYDHRPNKGLMIDLKSGRVNEIQDDKGFSIWAKNNRNDLLRSFNSEDRQGGKDAHWPRAGDVLDNLIIGNYASYEGRDTAISDKAVPVWETFNYSQSRDSDYVLKFGNLNDIAADYQKMNAKNAKSDNQTEVFGASQQSWKAAKEFWGKGFAYVPVLGNLGNIVFGVHDSLYGMTAADRVGGNAAVVISSLQLVHDLAQYGVKAFEPGEVVSPSSANNYVWRYSPETYDYEIVRVPKASESVETGLVNPPSVTEVAPTPPPLFEGMREVEYRGVKYFAADHPDVMSGTYYLLRVRDPKDPSKLASSAIVARPDETGVWKAHGREGGGWKIWERTPSPRSSDEVRIPPTLSDQFLELDGTKITGADTLDTYFEPKKGTAYIFFTKNVEDNGVIKKELNIEWSVKNKVSTLSEDEVSTVTEHGVKYTENFRADITRGNYTIETKLPDKTIQDTLTSTAPNYLERQADKINQFEHVIPNPELRARISEVAHQSAFVPVIGEFLDRYELPEKTLVKGMLKDDIMIINPDQADFHISYDPSNKVTLVTATSDFLLTTPTGERPDNISIKARRTFTIREGGDINNNLAVDENSPTHISISFKPD